MINESVFLGKKLVHHKIGSDKLLIVLNTHNQGEKYFGFSTLVENAKSDILFLTDPNNSYYLDNDLGSKYIKIISHFVDQYDTSKCCIFGTSMAGYAALYIGSELNLNIIASNPQVNIDLTVEKSWDDLRNSISKINNYHNLDYLFRDKFNGRNVYLIYGEHRLDIANAELLLSLPIYNSLIIRKKINDKSHGFFIKDLNLLFDIQDLLLSIK